MDHYEIKIEGLDLYDCGKWLEKQKYSWFICEHCGKEVIDKSSKNKGRKPRKYCKECSKIIENDIVSFSPKFCVDCGAELIIKANLKHRFTRCPVCQETRNKKLQADWVKNKRELLKVNKTNNVDIITPKTSI